jgi:hypothetical protein
MAAIRWREDAHLFAIAAVASASGSTATKPDAGTDLAGHAATPLAWRLLHRPAHRLYVDNSPLANQDHKTGAAAPVRQH